MNEHLAEFDRYVDAGMASIIELLSTKSGRAIVKAHARARFISGFDHFPDGRIFTWGVNRLMEEGLEEGADWLVYTTVRLAREEAERLGHDQPSQ